MRSALNPEDGEAGLEGGVDLEDGDAGLGVGEVATSSTASFNIVLDQIREVPHARRITIVARWQWTNLEFPELPHMPPPHRRREVPRCPKDTHPLKNHDTHVVAAHRDVT